MIALPRRVAAPLLLVALTVATYANSLQNGFVWDDAPVIVENPDTRDPAAMGRVLLSPDVTRPYYRPLNRASYLVDFQLFGMNPLGFHAVNIALHAGTVLLLYLLGRRLFATRSTAFLLAAIQAVHPLGSEPVNFVTARNNLFALLFALLTTLLFLDAIRRRSAWRALLSGLSYLLALASKEQAAMTLPLLAACLAIPGIADRSPRPREIAWLAPHGIALAAYAALRTLALGTTFATPAATEGLFSRLAQNLHTLPRYLALAIFPVDLTIAHAPHSSLGPGWLAIAWLAIGVVVAFELMRPTAAAIFGLLWFALNYVPVSNLVPIPSAAVAERFMYIPAVGLWILAADAAQRVYRSSTRRRLAVGAAAAGILLLATRTVARNREWRDDLSLWRSAVERDPRAVDAWFNLGVSLKERGEIASAGAAWRRGLEIAPGDGRTLSQLGTLAAVAGDHAAAEEYLLRAASALPVLAIAEFNLALLYERMGRAGEALEHWRRFLAIGSGQGEPEERLAFARARVSALAPASGR